MLQNSSTLSTAVKSSQADCKTRHSLMIEFCSSLGVSFSSLISLKTESTVKLGLPYLSFSRATTSSKSPRPLTTSFGPPFKHWFLRYITLTFGSENWTPTVASNSFINRANSRTSPLKVGRANLSNFKPGSLALVLFSAPLSFNGHTFTAASTHSTNVSFIWTYN